MNKNLYFLAIFVFVLVAVSGVLQSIFFLQLGAELIYLDAYLGWMWVVNMSSLLGSVILIKYLHFKRYWFCVVTSVIYLVASSCHSFIYYSFLFKRQLQVYLLPALIISLATFMVFGISLLFTGRRSGLKVAGGLIIILTLTLTAIHLAGTGFLNVVARDRLEGIGRWILFFGGLIPLAFIINFLGELKLWKEHQWRANSSRYFTAIITVAAVVALIFTFGFGITLGGEVNTKLYWRTQNALATQKLVDRFESRRFVGINGDSLQYLFLKPVIYNPAEKLPLVVCLPYGGYEGAAAAQLLLEPENRSRFRSFIFIPKCPAGAGWGGIPNYPSIDSLVYEALDALNEPGIDEKRRYVTGISRGGYGSWQFITSRPDLFAAAIPVCGGGNPDLAPKIRDVAVWAFHGEKDRNVPVHHSRAMIEAMKKAGASPRYTEFAGEGHSIWNRVSVTPGLLTWLFKQKQD